MTNTFDDFDLKILIKRIEAKKCTPFIGAGASVPKLPLGKEIASVWAKEYGYPLDDGEDLPRVSQYLAIKDANFPREEIRNWFKPISPPDFSQPDEPHALLADLNLPIYITTNYDSFMVDALKNRERNPKRELCQWFPEEESKNPSETGAEDQKTDYEPTSENPLVYHLHGHYDVLQSMVLTEDDYLNFLANLSTESEITLPSSIRTALADTTLLFIGYSLSDWNFRVLFRGLIGSVKMDTRYPSVAVQLSPSSLADKSVEGMNRAQVYLAEYFEKIHKVPVKVYWGNAREFTIMLRQKWEELKNGTK